jgi:LmbE family N-acetylglucosaminyl deacetylase
VFVPAGLKGEGLKEKIMNPILGKKLLFVTAHPDDESYSSAGTILRNHDAGGASYLACATLGEKGKSHIKKKTTPGQVKLLRKKELLAASKYLKISGLLLTDLPDTEMGIKANQEAFFKKVTLYAARLRPDFIISFGQDGISGHLDHIAVGKIAKKVAKQLRIPFLVFSAPPELYKSIQLLKKRRTHGKYVKQLKREPHDIAIKIDPRKKLRALRFHKSQMDDDGPLAKFPRKTVRQVLSREYYAFR